MHLHVVCRLTAAEKQRESTASSSLILGKVVQLEWEHTDKYWAPGRAGQGRGASMMERVGISWNHPCTTGLRDSRIRIILGKRVMSRLKNSPSPQAKRQRRNSRSRAGGERT
jgi:hypothetical protein